TLGAHERLAHGGGNPAATLSMRKGTSGTRGDRAMSDFSEEIRRRVAAAREAADEQKNAVRQQAQSHVDQLARRKSRATELCAEIDQRFQEAAAGSSGAMVYSQQT